MAPLLPQLGITRVADITGLDRIGIPVAAAIRPNSRSVSVAQGKGVTLDAAKASAVMEAIEGYHAEHPRLPLLHGSPREVAALHPVADLAHLPVPSTSIFHADLPMLWATAVDLAAGVKVLVPYEVVHTDFRAPLPTGSGAFLMSSNGLASGNNLPEALSHGLCELVERDSNALFVVSGGMKRRSARIAPSTVAEDRCQALLTCFERAELEVGIWETTSDVGLPSFMAMIVDRDPYVARAMPPMTGSGCHPRRHIALSRALTEAAQGRLTVIAGSRDDIASRSFDEGEARRESATYRDLLASVPAERSFAGAPDFDHPTFDEDLALELGCLASAGLTQVLSVNLSRPELGIAVVRVIVPGLEGVTEGRGGVLGRRARRAASLGDA